MKKSIIIIAYGCSDRNCLSPNAACTIKLSDYLKQYYDVHIITDTATFDDKILHYYENGIHIHAFPTKSYVSRNIINIDSKSAKNYIIKNIGINSISVCIAVSYPFMQTVIIMHKLIKMNPKIKKVIYEFDPLAFNGASGFSFPKMLPRIFIEAIEFFRADQVWLTRELYKEYQNNIFKIFKKKFVNIGIPLFTGDVCTTPPKKSLRDKESKIILVYSGTFYDHIRKPDYLIELMKQVTQKIDGDLHIYGTVLGSESEIVLNQAKDFMGENLKIHGKINRSKVPEVLSNADILINVSNTVANQLPSKVFEYIQTGKPIINISTIENDSSEYYLERYPLALLIVESWEKGKIDVNVKKIIEFCLLNVGKSADIEEVNTLYSDYTADKIAIKVKDYLTKII